MKKTINRKGYPGMLCVDGRPDRTKASRVRPQEVQPEKKSVTLSPLNPQEPYPIQDEITPSGVVESNYSGDVMSNTIKSKKKWSS